MSLFFRSGLREELRKALGWFKPWILWPEFQTKGPSDFIIRKRLRQPL